MSLTFPAGYHYYVYFIAEFSELIHVDKRKDRPEGTSSSVKLSRSFGKFNRLACSDALVKALL